MSATEYYNHTTFPASNAAGSSASMRAELEAVEAGFGKLPDLSGNGGKVVAVNAGGTALEAVSSLTVAQGGTGRATGTTAYGLIAAGTTATGEQQTLAAGLTTQILVGGGASALPVWTAATGSGAPVRATSPTLETPVLGVATATNVAIGGAKRNGYGFTCRDSASFMLQSAAVAWSVYNTTLGVDQIDAIPTAQGGVIQIGIGTDHPVGGAQLNRLGFGPAANDFGVYHGSGVPTVSAAKGSLYLRTDGSATSNRMYVNTDGGTTWTAVITAA